MARREPKSEGCVTVGIINDIHYPDHDSKVLNLALNFLEDLKPDRLVLNGDIIDCWAISRWKKDPSRLRNTLDKEVRWLETFIDRCGKIAPKIDYLMGNHEDRICRYVMEFADLFGPLGTIAQGAIDALRPEAIIGKGTTLQRYKQVISLGKLLITHGHLIRKYTDSAMLAKYGGSIGFGHTHRLGTYYHTNHSGPHVAFQNGCLCKLSPPWKPELNDWQHGLSIVKVFKDGTFHLQQVPILKRRFLYYGDKRYTA